MSERKLTDREIDTLLSDYTIMRDALIEIMTADSSIPNISPTVIKMRKLAETAISEIEG